MCASPSSDCSSVPLVCRRNTPRHVSACGCTHQGCFDVVKSAVEAEGRRFERELNDLYVSGTLARAVLASDPSFAAGEVEARQTIRAQFPPQAADIATEEFLRAARDALAHASGGTDRLPCTLVVLDEVQQYIGDSAERSMLVTEVAEAVEKQLDSRVMIVGAGQSALTDAPLLQKLMDRFTIRIPLSDADVETVTRKVLLQKKPSAIDGLHALLDRHSGEISRQLQGTRLGETPEDRATLVDDYPLLPVRRRFWEECFRQIDAAGTHSQLRSQLRIVHDALGKLAARPLGAVVPGDELFDALAPEMVNTGVLLREINERIIAVDEAEGALARRLCGLIFLIGRLARDAGADTGIRATKGHLADLVIDDLTSDNGQLRGAVDTTLGKLADDGILMRVGEEYRLQTRQGAEWDREFRNRQTRLSNDSADVQFRRDEFLYGEIDKVVRSLRMVQGTAKEPRGFAVHRGASPPPASDGSSVPVWIRDGWAASEKEVAAAARSAGAHDPVIHVFVPRRSADDLRRLIVEAAAAEQTLDARGNPTEPEGQEARRSMESRRARAEVERNNLVHEIASSAKVFQGGGGEVLLASLEDRLRAAGEDSLARLFPRFKEADGAVWPAAIKRAREGADHPLQPVGHTEAVEKHAVCRQAIVQIGAGASGAAVRKALAGPPFGWPRDAVDAALIALHRSRHLSATLNGAAIAPGGLDQNRIAKAAFRVERAVLSAQDRIALRKLFQAADVPCKSGEEEERAGIFLERLAELAGSAGGAPPLPASSGTADIEDVSRLAGNERLAAIRGKADEWEERIGEWRTAAQVIAARLPVWRLVERLAAHAEGLEEAGPQLREVAAVREGRQLLADADPAAGVRKALADLFRASVRSGSEALEAAFAEAMRTLDANEAWRRVEPTDREVILKETGLTEPEKPDVATDEALADCLDRRSLAGVRAEIDAIPVRAARAVERAARLLEPKVRPVGLERATLRDATEVEAWAERQKKVLLEAVGDGPVLVG